LKYRRYVYLVIGFVFAVLLFNVTVWFFATKTVLSGDSLIGDLARIGYLPEIIHAEKTDGHPAGRHMNYWEYDGQKVDIVTVGDSFSQGGGNGYYQDWIVAATGKRVLNLNEMFWYQNLQNRFDPIINLLNDGFFDGIRPKFLLVQNVERNSENLQHVTDWMADNRATEFRMFLDERREKTRLDEVASKGFFNAASFKYVLNRILYSTIGHDYNKKVFSADLQDELFSGGMGDKVVFFFQDLRWAQKQTSQIAVDVNKNMNILAELLREKGIELIFLPAVDKYDLYRDFMFAPKYPEISFFETLRELPKNYHLIDSKMILHQLLRDGEKDVYWQDDTHWSWKASKAIAENIATVVNP